MGRHLIIRQQHRYRQQMTTDGYKQHMALLPFFGFTAKNDNVADATHSASAPIADAGKTAPAPGAGAVAIFLDVGCRLLPMPRFGTVSGNGTRHRWKRVNPTRTTPAKSCSSGAPESAEQIAVLQILNSTLYSFRVRRQE